MKHKIEIKKDTSDITNDTNFGNSFINVNAPTTELGISDEGLIIAKNADTTLFDILTNLITALNVFNAALTAAGTSGVLAPVGAAAVALTTTLVTVQLEITSLLSPTDK